LAIDKLDAALSAVEWARNVTSFLTETEVKEKLVTCNLRLATWSKQLEQVDKDNPALAFVREMQSAGHMVVALTALALYKPAAGSIRTLVETALYYTYFRTHHCELATLLREKSYFVDKREIIEYHKLHTVNFKDVQQRLGLLTLLEKSYGSLSAIVHGQLPGVWTSTSALKNIAHVHRTCGEVVKKFVEAEEVVHRLFLCTIAPTFWAEFSTTAKKPLLKGLTGDLKAFLKLDEC
jgi:hypothetical protein